MHCLDFCIDLINLETQCVIQSIFLISLLCAVGVQLTAVVLITEMCEKSHDTLVHFKKVGNISLFIFILPSFNKTIAVKHCMDHFAVLLSFNLKFLCAPYLEFAVTIFPFRSKRIFKMSWWWVVVLDIIYNIF